MGNSAHVASCSYKTFNSLNPDLSSDQATPELSDTQSFPVLVQGLKMFFIKLLHIIIINKHIIIIII